MQPQSAPKPNNFRAMTTAGNKKRPAQYNLNLHPWMVKYTGRVPELKAVNVVSKCCHATKVFRRDLPQKVQEVPNPLSLRKEADILSEGSLIFQNLSKGRELGAFGSHGGN
jgi:hypothetical protein